MSEETTPLLGVQPKPTTRWLWVYLLSTHTFFISLAFAMVNTPMSQLMEDNLCHQYVQGNTVKEGFCKNNHIQFELATIMGYMPVMEAVVSMFQGRANKALTLTGGSRSDDSFPIWSLG